MKITAHTLVKNEERYLWYAVMSIIDHIDEILLWDTGSTDNTIKIIQDLKKRYPSKVKVKLLGDVDIQEFTKVRQKMLEETESDWVFILDGDEVWWRDKIEETTHLMRTKPELQTIVSEYRNLIGDIFHYQDEKASFYKIDDKTGPYTVRAMSMKNIKGLNVSKPHGTQGFFDGQGKLVQELTKSKRQWVTGVSYLHFTHLIRSSNLESDKKVIKRNIKYKHELGHSFDLNFYYPEAFFLTRPSFVQNVWVKADKKYLLRAKIETPLRKMKRLLFTHKSGY